MKKVLITGSSGLVGSAAVEYFDAAGWDVHGVDNHMRRNLFGPEGDTELNLRSVGAKARNFHHSDLDVRDREGMLALFSEVRPDLVIHAAAQPSHDLAAERPFDDFDINAVGTLNALEATRRHVPEAAFCFLSSNKVYGDVPNEIPMVELETRWDYADPAFAKGIDEQMRVDRCTHSLYGASKAAADLMVQEYGLYFGLKTVCFRGSCLTGPAHAAVEQHGFLGYLVKCCKIGRPYRIFGYKGKQVRDNIHAYDVCRIMEAYFQQPRCGEVYNLGGGRANSVSILEAIALAEAATGRKMEYEYVDENRLGDHICYITSLDKLRRDYPMWNVSISLPQIVEELAKRAEG